MQTSPTSGGPAGPVFVDRSGRRLRLIGRAGVVVALLGAAYAGTLVVLSLTGAHIDAPGLPHTEQASRLLRSEPRASHRSPAATGTAAPRSAAVAPAVADLGVAESPAVAAPAAAADEPTTQAPSTSAVPTAGPTAASTPSPTAVPTATSTAQGRSATAPGASHRATPTPGAGRTDATGQARPTAHP